MPTSTVTNSWNLNFCKQRLEILHRTQSQKKHLLSLINAKTRLDSRNLVKSRVGSISCHANKEKNSRRSNFTLAKRVAKLDQSRHNQTMDEWEKSRQLSRNLQTYSSANRTMRLKAIEMQNEKIFSRLVTTMPTIRRKQWIIRAIETSSYKQNLHRSKHLRPDYSKEACKIIVNDENIKFKIVSGRRQMPEMLKVNTTKLFR